MEEHKCSLVSSARWKNAATSVLLSRTLDNIGYGFSMVRLRQDIYNIEKEPNETCTVILSGSKAEGLSKPLESDFDCLIFVQNFICTTVPQNYIRENGWTIFQLDIVDTYPGYARLLHDGPVNDDEIESIMYSTCGLSYLPSDKLRLLLKKLSLSIRSENENNYELYSGLECSGPSCPLFVSTEYFLASFDNVIGILCNCPDILRKWIYRQRNDFPSADVIQEISNMEAHAVPVGYKESEWQFLEWRICFTKAEIRLVQSLNDCQTKLLILLRKIAKLYLKPKCNEMSSYIMKNIVLWMSEQMPGNYFIEENICHALETSLKLLRSCLIRKRLPSYMIAERNLLAGRVTVHERSELCREIESLLREGPRVVLKWNHVSSALNRLYYSPDTYFNASKFYFLIELLFFRCSFQNSSLEENQLLYKLVVIVLETLISVYPELLVGCSERLLNNIFKVFLS